MKAILLSLLIAFSITGCDHLIIENPTICDSTIYHDSIVPVDSLIIRDSVIYNYRDSIARIIKDTVRLIEVPGHNIQIQGAKEHITFNIDLDSIKVLIRNDSIIDVWQRPAKL